MRRFPPIPELIAFEAVARHLSFTQAAQELYLTQSAVSHRIRRLETYLETPLIRRLNPGLELTERGAALLPEIAAVLDKLSSIGKNNERRLRVVAGTALCQWWLAGRLNQFQAEHPGVSIDLIPRDVPDPSLTDVDLWITWVGAEGNTNRHSAPLFSEWVFPVCNPQLLPDARPLKDKNDLATLPLLHKAVQAHGEWSWEIWAQRLDINFSGNARAELRFADMSLMMAAAVNGSGVALVRSLIAFDALNAGTVVIPIQDFEPMHSIKKHVAQWPSNRQDDPDVDAFVRWLVAEAAQTLARTEDLIFSESHL